MVMQIFEVNEIKRRMKSNPNVQKLVKDQEIKEKTALSPYTLVENSVVGLTQKHLILQNNEKAIGSTMKGQASV